MNKTKHVVDSEGEVIIVLICPSYPFAPWNEEKTEDEFEAAEQAPDGEEHKDEDCFCIQVSAKHLILSSPVWQESFLLLKKGSVEITVCCWDLEAFIILMDIFHCQPRNLPREVILELLAKIGMLADYYECRALVRYFMDSGLITSLGLPIPGKAINYINSRRENAILAILSSLNSHRDAFLDGSRGCSFDCSSTLFGALTKHIHSNALLSPQTEPHFPGLSYHGLEGTIQAPELQAL
ncbi:hypothetical protein BDV33DRAFT_188356 [Aspergillus novoparasiticus]|uniref:BTB domain-containing protein n=1 Tax=Aspergillus novoparasiticus TaxID=986946 RepID=A0A5N6F3H8_9EURO|nr:hypothetical protein BDV33DRAFT_188356 [Aspergillus novoparasiticus]